MEAKFTLDVPVQRSSKLVPSQHALPIVVDGESGAKVVLRLAGQGLEVQVGDERTSGPSVLDPKHFVM